MTRRFRVGIQLHPQVTSMDALRAAAREADALGVDTLWTWDHFFPLYDHGSGEVYYSSRDDTVHHPYPDHADPLNAHFEGWTTITAVAVDTVHAQVGVLVTCNGYRSPDLLVDMARTLDHVSGGRAILGVGAGWFRRDYDEYGFDFGTIPSRLAALEAGLERIAARRDRLNPPPLGRLPVCIGGGGEKVTLRLVAQHADIWNGFGPPEAYARRNRVLDDWCGRVGRDPAAVERSALLWAGEVDRVGDYLAAGAQHLIVQCPAPFDLAPLRTLLAAAEG